MTISSTGTRFSYSGNGATTVFSFPRQFFADADLDVYLVDNTTKVATLQVLATHYTVSGAGSPSGGSVTMLTAPATGKTLVIARDTAASQGLDLDNVTSLPMTSLEAALDRAMMVVDEVKAAISRAIMYPIYGLASSFNWTMPEPVANKVIGINATGTGLELKGPQAWTNGVGAPSGAAGLVGDYYLDTSTGDVYLKTGTSTWTLQANMRGPQGTNGSMIGPGSSVVGNLPTFGNISGSILQDSGVALSALAPLAGPGFSGTPTAPTPAAGTNNTRIATAAFVNTAIAAGGATSATVTAGTNAQGQGALTSDFNIITTAASNPSGVTLPTATIGRMIMIVNKGANIVNIYPATGAAIDALGANTSIALPVGGFLLFRASTPTQWYSSNTGSFTTDASGNVTTSKIFAATQMVAQANGVNANIYLSSVGGSGRSYLIASNTDGTLTFYDATAGATRLILDPSGAFGYSAGGSVTQITSKATGVTFNKPSGQITMNAAALAASTTVGFTLTNSAISATDSILVAVAFGATSNANYQCWGACGTGLANIYVRNISAGSQSEAVVLNFVTYKG
jgi:hypothetical protein